MTDLKLISQAELLEKSRDLRDRVEISMHKLGSKARGYQGHLNAIVADLTQENSQPVDERQTSLLDTPRVGQPTAKPKPERKAKPAPKPKKSTAKKVNLPTSTSGKPSTEEKRLASIRKVLSKVKNGKRTWEAAAKHGLTDQEIKVKIKANWPAEGKEWGLDGKTSPMRWSNNPPRVWFQTYVSPGDGKRAIKGDALVKLVRKAFGIGKPEVFPKPLSKYALKKKNTAKPNKGKAISAGIKKSPYNVANKKKSAAKKIPAKRATYDKKKDIPGLVDRWCNKCNGYHKPGEHYEKKATNAASMPKRRPRKPNPQFMAPLHVDKALAEIVGSKPIPRTTITMKFWDYIKKHGLQDKKNRRQINCDDKLRGIFGTGHITMFELNKLMQKHISTKPFPAGADAVAAAAGHTRKQKAPKKSRKIDTPEIDEEQLDVVTDE